MPDYERIYQAWNKYDENGKIDAGKGVALPLADELKRSFPEVEYAAMTDWMNSYNLKADAQFACSVALIISTIEIYQQVQYAKAVEKLRSVDPINQTLTWREPAQKIRIIGVVENALMQSSFSPAEPAVFIYDPAWTGVISYRLEPESPLQATIRKLEIIFNKYNREAEFMYEFVDDNYASKFNAEILVGKLSGLFAILAVFISCIGLFGLVAYVTEQRTREIGIRKVLGGAGCTGMAVDL